MSFCFCHAKPVCFWDCDKPSVHYIPPGLSGMLHLYSIFVLQIWPDYQFQVRLDCYSDSTMSSSSDPLQCARVYIICYDRAHLSEPCQISKTDQATQSSECQPCTHTQILNYTLHSCTVCLKGVCVTIHTQILTHTYIQKHTYHKTITLTNCLPKTLISYIECRAASLVRR